MANLIETANWDDPVYLIEPYDPHQGGSGEFAISNIQSRQLANRTQWLLGLFLKEHNIDGAHKLVQTALAADAMIRESKLALDFNTSDLSAKIDKLKAAREAFQNRINTLLNTSGSLVDAVYQALVMSWELGEFRISFDLFKKDFTFRDGFVDLPVLKTVKLDDSVDVVDTSVLNIGEKYMIHGTDTVKNKHAVQEVTVAQILSDTRVLFEENLLYSSENGYLTRYGFDNNTTLQPGHIYYTKEIDALEGVDSGELFAFIDKQDPTVLSVFIEHNGAMLPVLCNEIGFDLPEEDGYYKASYTLPGTKFKLYIRNATNEDVFFHHLVIARGVDKLQKNLVRRPYIKANNTKGFYATRYGCLYDLAYKDAEVDITRIYNGTSYAATLDMKTLGWPHGGIEQESVVYNNTMWRYDLTNTSIYGSYLPEWFFNPVISRNAPIRWRIRHQNEEDEWSLWSDWATCTGEY